MLIKIKDLLEDIPTLVINFRSQIKSQFEEVASEYDKRLAPLTDDLELMNSGLDSLCFAVLVVRLEREFGLDPFSESDDALFPVTFGDFVHFYENSAK